MQKKSLMASKQLTEEVPFTYVRYVQIFIHTYLNCIVKPILAYIQEVNSSSDSESDRRVKHTLKRADKVLKKLKV